MNCSRCEGKDPNCNVCRDIPEETPVRRRMVNKEQANPNILTLQEIASEYGYSVSFVRGWYKSGMITSVSLISNRARFNRAEVKEAVAKKTAEEELKRQSKRRF